MKNELLKYDFSDLELKIAAAMLRGEMKLEPGQASRDVMREGTGRIPVPPEIQKLPDTNRG